MVAVTTPKVWGAALVSSLGARRRCAALACIGWGPAELAPYLRLADADAVRMSINQAQMPRQVHDRWVRVYRELMARPGPNATVAAYAARQGWAGPMCWGDDIDQLAAIPARNRLHKTPGGEVSGG